MNALQHQPFQALLVTTLSIGLLRRRRRDDSSTRPAELGGICDQSEDIEASLDGGKDGCERGRHKERENERGYQLP